jgi:hypothetical protein
MCVVQTIHPENLTCDKFYYMRGVGDRAKDDWAWIN